MELGYDKIKIINLDKSSQLLIYLFEKIKEEKSLVNERSIFKINKFK